MAEETEEKQEGMHKLPKVTRLLDSLTPVTPYCAVSPYHTVSHNKRKGRDAMPIPSNLALYGDLPQQLHAI